MIDLSERKTMPSGNREKEKRDFEEMDFVNFKVFRKRVV